MATDTFTGDFDWVVPDDNGSVILRCYGGRGDDGSASGDETDSANGANGALVEGELNVSAGDVLYIREISGGNGNYASWDGNSGHANAGNGGNGISIRHGSPNDSDTVIVAGGGGGGGAAVADDWESPDVDAGGGGAGGGDGQDGGDGTGTAADSTGGTGGGRSSMSGGDGNSRTDGHSSVGSAGAGGGGGGGWRGGGGGGADAWAAHSATYGSFEDATGSGGGGGDGYTGGVYNTSTTVGFNSGGSYVEIEYTPTPNPPTTLNRTVNHQGPNINVFWNVHDSITDGFYIYRSQTQGFTPGSGNRIATINDGSTRGYMDTNVERGVEYFYRVSAFESTSTNESDPSIETQGTAGEVVKIDEGGFFTQYPIKYDDGSAWEYASELWIFQSGGGYSATEYGDNEYGSSGGGWQEQ